MDASVAAIWRASLRPVRQGERDSAEQRLRSLVFDKQREFLDDRSKVKSMLCGRRAGKSWLIAVLLLMAALRRESVPDDVWCVYIALTRINAKKYFWPVLKRVAKLAEIDCSFSEGDLVCKVNGGGRIILGGCEDEAAIERWRGGKFLIAIVDECGAFPEYLESLIGDAIMPSLADLDGELFQAGTPGQVLRGYWYDRTGVPGTNPYRWTMFDNPHMPHAEAFAGRMLAERGWTRSTPAFIREYLGLWTRSTEVLVYPYDERRNGVDELPFKSDDPGWRWCIAVDPGQVEAAGFVVLGAHKYDRYEYVVESEKHPGMLIDDMADKIRGMLARWPGASVVMDTGGMGKQHAFEIQKRHGIPVSPADKRDRASNVRLSHDGMMSGRIKLLDGPQNAAIRSEIEVLQWNEDRTDHNKAQRDPKTGKKEDHCCDAGFVYGVPWLRHYSHSKKTEKARPGTKEFYAEQERQMIEKLEKEHRQ